MANSYFKFKQFTIQQDRSAMKVTTDSCLFGAWVAREVNNKKREVKNMLDIGTGTGLLTLMVAQKNPHLVIDSIEIDSNAYTQANENILEAGFRNEIRISNSDIHDDIAGRKYDVIVCNPPFYANELKSGDSLKNLAHHDNGLLLEDLLPVIKARLAIEGFFYLLLPYKRKNELESLFRKNQLYPTKKISVRQSVKHDYFRLQVEGSLHDDKPVTENEISICNETGDYTPEFISLLKDYYLYL
ncbi:MAG TPA: methyltransferase [Chitinophagaceae bacterium]|nr:methyltransferase [Chitinophagaceae bacterium]